MSSSNAKRHDFSRAALVVWHPPVRVEEKHEEAEEDEEEEKAAPAEATATAEIAEAKAEKDHKQKLEAMTRLLSQRRTYHKTMDFANRYGGLLRIVDARKGNPVARPLEVAKTDATAGRPFLDYPLALFHLLDETVALESPVHYAALILPVVEALHIRGDKELLQMAMDELRDAKRFTPYFGLLAEMWIARDKVTPRMFQSVTNADYERLVFGPRTKEMFARSWDFTLLYKADMCLQLEQLQRDPPRNWHPEKQLLKFCAQWHCDMGGDAQIPMPLMKRLYNVIINGCLKGGTGKDGKKRDDLYFYPRPDTPEERKVWARMAALISGARPGDAASTAEREPVEQEEQGEDETPFEVMSAADVSASASAQ